MSGPSPPMLTQKVLGFREWRRTGSDLLSIGARRAPWRPGANTARCVHPAPDPDCGCGLYALHAPAWQPPHGDVVTGAVLAWGRIEVHTGGFRAEYAEPMLLAYGGGQPAEHVKAVRSIAAEFGVPCVPHGELATAAAQLGEPVPTELRPVHAPAGVPRPRPPTRMADELLMIALHADEDGWIVDHHNRPLLPNGIWAVAAGAELAELALLGRIECISGRIELVDRSSTGDAGMNQALNLMASWGNERRPEWWVQKLAEEGSGVERLWELHQRGLVREYEQVKHGRLGTKQIRRWCIPELGPDFAVLERWHHALERGAADERTVRMLSLARAIGEPRLFFSGMGWRERRRRLAPITRVGWVEAAVKRSLGPKDAISVAT